MFLAVRHANDIGIKAEAKMKEGLKLGHKDVN
jgi:hypothetical protein